MDCLEASLAIGAVTARTIATTLQRCYEGRLL